MATRRRRPRSFKVSWVDLDDMKMPDDDQTMTVAMFCRHNGDDPHLCRRVRSLKPGQSIRVGGGAAPLIEIRRPGKARR